MKLFKYSLLSALLLLVSACATLKIQIADDQNFEEKKDSSKLVHSFYLIGDAGNSTLTKDSPGLVYLREKIKGASKKSTLLFLGDNVYEAGIPKKKSKKYPLAKRRIKAQTKVTKSAANTSVKFKFEPALRLSLLASIISLKLKAVVSNLFFFFHFIVARVVHCY